MEEISRSDDIDVLYLNNNMIFMVFSMYGAIWGKQKFNGDAMMVWMPWGARFSQGKLRSWL